MKKDEHCPVADSLNLNSSLFIGVFVLEKYFLPSKVLFSINSFHRFAGKL